MKRLIVSLSLLALLIGLGFWNAARLEGVCGVLSKTLEEAQLAGESGDWERAEALTRQAEQYWDAQSTYLYILLRHDCTDEVSSDFRELLALIEWEETPEYAAASRRLIALLEHLGRSEQLTWENLL